MLDTKSNLISGLYLVSTPIGNLGDITHRAEEVLAAADVIACEDTRTTGKLLELLGIKAKSFLPYHEHNADTIRPKILALIASGKSVALVSDAGTPLISDPGYRLVRECARQSLYVTSCPGASAVLTALQLSGLPSDKFLFCGFLPTKSGARLSELQSLSSIEASLVFYESPHRLSDTLQAMAEVFTGRNAAVVRELTKRFEEAVRLPIAELAAHYQESGAPKGEIVIVIAPPVKVTTEDIPTEAALLLSRLLKFMSVKDASSVTSEHYNLSKKSLYNEALKLKNGTESD